MTTQFRLPLPQSADYSRARFATSPVNRPALEQLDAWAAWPGGALALVGPEGSGKTHLAHLWAAETGARVLDAPPPDVSALAGERLVIENADAWPDAECLFHLLNMTQTSGALLLTSRLAPAAWPTLLPDLRSRLNGLVVANLGEPDDIVLAAVLTALFNQRHIRPARDVIPYLIFRMERSVAAARAIVERLDEAASSQGREINRALAIECLELNNVIDDLFHERG